MKRLLSTLEEALSKVGMEIKTEITSSVELPPGQREMSFPCSDGTCARLPIVPGTTETRYLGAWLSPSMANAAASMIIDGFLGTALASMRREEFNTESVVHFIKTAIYPKLEYLGTHSTIDSAQVQKWERQIASRVAGVKTNLKGYHFKMLPLPKVEGGFNLPTLAHRIQKRFLQDTLRLLDTGDKLRRDGKVSLAYRVLQGEALALTHDAQPEVGLNKGGTTMTDYLVYESGFHSRLKATLDYCGWQLHYEEDIPTSALSARVSIPTAGRGVRVPAPYWGNTALKVKVGKGPSLREVRVPLDMVNEYIDKYGVEHWRRYAAQDLAVCGMQGHEAVEPTLFRPTDQGWEHMVHELRVAREWQPEGVDQLLTSGPLKRTHVCGQGTWVNLTAYNGTEVGNILSALKQLREGIQEGKWEKQGTQPHGPPAPTLILTKYPHPSETIQGKLEKLMESATGDRGALGAIIPIDPRAAAWLLPTLMTRWRAQAPGTLVRREPGMALVAIYGEGERIGALGQWLDAQIKEDNDLYGSYDNPESWSCPYCNEVGIRNNREYGTCTRCKLTTFQESCMDWTWLRTRNPKAYVRRGVRSPRPEELPLVAFGDGSGQVVNFKKSRMNIRYWGGFRERTI